ncbi:uncharacterized protein slow isoform X2 [Eurosta solidaginis]|uniref:uncharacterized protein slow isoform X2 n=1 Tax=Eurosta solidaginis TaxID=178769 RepID=UPI0035307B4D
MAKILYFVVILTVLIVSCFLRIHARASIEQSKPNPSSQAHISVIRRHRNHHAHHYHQQKMQHQPQQQQQFSAQRRQQRLDNTLISSATNVDVGIITNNTRSILGPQALQRRSTRLRRLSARDYYNSNVAQRRLNNLRSNYHVYNARSNTFEVPPNLSSPGAVTVADGNGKGDDNTNDIEFISQSGTGAFNPNWNNNRRGLGFMPPHTTAAPSTHPPPPLVPDRRGYVTLAPPNLSAELPHSTTDKPNEMSNIDVKEREKRHICVQQRTITMPVKTTEVYARPIWKHVNTPCSAVQVQTHNPNQMCTRVQLVHEQAFRDVIRHKSSQQVTYDCCSGWERETPHSDACMKPICSMHCQNGGTCSAPDTCSCTLSFAGKFCEHDVNECNEDKPCDQICVNTVGSYFCKCRDGFVLKADQQSCKKIDLHDDDAFEARDLENDIEASANEDMSARLQKIERSLANERVHTHELQKSLQATYSVVDTLKTRLSTIEKQQQDINRLQSNLYDTESRTNKLEGMLNLLMKCRNGPSAYCP